MKSKRNDIITALIIITAAVVYYVQTFQIPIRSMTSVTLSSRVFPQIVAILLIIMSLIMIVVALREKTVPNEAEYDPEQKQRTRSAITALFLLIVCIFFMKQLGFVICAAAYMFFSFVTLTPKEQRHNVRYLLVSIALAIVIYYLFYKGFDVLLPGGVLKSILT